MRLSRIVHRNQLPYIRNIFYHTITVYVYKSNMVYLTIAK